MTAKFRWIFVIGLLVVVAAMAAFPGKAGTNIVLKIGTQEPKVPATVAVYRVKPLHLTEEVVLGLARKMGMPTEGEIREEGGLVVYRAGDFSLEVYKASGAFWFMDTTRLLMPDELGAPIFSEAEARQICESYLIKFGLMPAEGAVFEGVHQVRDAAVGEGGNATHERVVETAVVFRRTVGGIPVVGPGSSIFVYLDNDGQVSGVYKNWREIEAVPVGVVRTIGTDSIVKQVRSRFKKGADLTVNVVAFRFGYLDLGPDEAQSYLQPVFLLSQEIVGGFGTAQVVDVLPAAEKTFEELISLGRQLPDGERKALK